MTLPPAYFDRMYADDRDPWGFEQRWYEQRKYAVALGSLPRQHYRRGFEPGCSIGVLTELLAPRCDELLATDVAAAALETARQRLAGATNVELRMLSVPDEWPAGEFDLIVLSELGYYLAAPELATLLDRAVASLSADGTLLACHWRHPVEDYPLRGDDVHAALARLPQLDGTVRHVEADFILEVYEPAPGRSVAQRAGLA